MVDDFMRTLTSTGWSQCARTVNSALIVFTITGCLGEGGTESGRNANYL